MIGNIRVPFCIDKSWRSVAPVHQPSWSARASAWLILFFMIEGYLHTPNLHWFKKTIRLSRYHTCRWTMSLISHKDLYIYIYKIRIISWTISWFARFDGNVSTVISDASPVRTSWTITVIVVAVGRGCSLYSQGPIGRVGRGAAVRVPSGGQAFRGNGP